MKNWRKCFNAGIRKFVVFFLIIFLNTNLLYAQADATPPNRVVAPDLSIFSQVTQPVTEVAPVPAKDRKFPGNVFYFTESVIFGVIKGTSDAIGFGCDLIVDTVGSGFRFVFKPLNKPESSSNS